MNTHQKKALKILNYLASNPTDYSYSDLFKLLIKHIPSIPFQYDNTKHISDYWHDNYEWERDKCIIYRARENKDEDLWNSYHKPPYFFLNEISIVPPEALDNVEFGRCNKAREPRFYASTKYNVACIEAITSGFPLEGRQIGNMGGSTRATTGEWKIQENLNLVYINHSKEMLEMVEHINSEYYSNCLKQITVENEHYISKLTQMCMSADEIDYYLSLKDFFTSQFNKIEINSEHDYYLSNFYCDLIFDYSKTNNNEPIDGIVYPSVAFSMQNKNIVLHPRALKKINATRAFNTWMVYFPHSNNIEFIPDNSGWAGKITNGEITYPLYQKWNVKKYAAIPQG